MDGVPIKEIKRREAQEQKALAKVEVFHGEVVNMPLSEEERKEHEAKVNNILNGFQDIARTSLQIWKDLQWIQQNKTYREKYDTFQDFCRDELGKDNSQIYRYIKDAEFKENLLLSASSDEERLSILSLKESNTRYLRTLPEEVHMPFWKIAYGIGVKVLPKKEDGSIEPTTGFLESVGERVEEAIAHKGVTIDGTFIKLEAAHEAAEAAGVDDQTAKTILLTAGVSEDYFETLERQKQHIREKSTKNEVLTLKGTIEQRQDVNGSSYPVIVDARGNELDLAELLLSFNNRFLNLSLRAPIRQ